MAHITIVATGGIRAPTALELLDRFSSDGHEVRILASAKALRFLWAHMIPRPALIGKFLRHFRPQFRETIAYFAHKRIGVPHIAEGKWADVFVMAPATGNSIGKLVAGLSDTYPLLVLRAVPRTKRVIVVLSMNPEMWFDPHFQRNVDLLNATEKYQVLCPSRGQMASGDFGIGAQAPVDDIVASTYRTLGIADPALEVAFGARQGTVPWDREELGSVAGGDEAIVVVDEDRALRHEIAATLSRTHPRRPVMQFDRPREALEWLRENRAAVVFSELAFADGANGHDLVEFLRQPGSLRDCQIVVTSAKNRWEAGAERLARQDVLFVPKPLNVPFAVGMVAGLVGGGRRPPATATRSLATGEVLFAEGDLGTEVYVIESGGSRWCARRKGGTPCSTPSPPAISSGRWRSSRVPGVRPP